MARQSYTGSVLEITRCHTHKATKDNRKNKGETDHRIRGDQVEELLEPDFLKSHQGQGQKGKGFQKGKHHKRRADIPGERAGKRY